MDRLLRPRSIAVVGGGAWCANVIEQCARIGFAGPVWPVHPKRESVAGVPAFASIDALPEAPDATFIGVNREATLEVVQALVDRGAGGAVCFASGFLEAQAEMGDGADMQDALLRAAGEMPILGPNCYGFINYLDGAALWPDQHGGSRAERGVAIVTQSSNIALNLTMQRRALPLAYVVTVGNQAQQGLWDVAAALLRDDRVTAIALHVEGVGDLRRLEAFAAEAHACGKPVIALKVGRSEQAQVATVSHTASLAGGAAGAEALFARLGIGQVSSLSAMLETLKLLHVAGPLKSNRIASLSCSGGEACLMADGVVDRGLRFPPLDEGQQSALRAALGPKVALANPLDYHTYIWGDEEALTATFSAMMSGDLAMGCVVLDFPRADRCDPAAWEPVIAAVQRTQEQTGKPLALLGSIAEAISEEVAERLLGLGVIPFTGMEEALAAMEIAAFIGMQDAAAAPLCLPNLDPSGETLTEAAAKAELAAFGLSVPGAQEAVAETVGAVSEEIGFPVVLKGQGIAHKTEAGAVALGLTRASAVTQAAAAMPTERFLVEEMITGAVCELIVGVVADPHGYVLTLGAGGTLTEILQDTATLLVPASRQAVDAALNELKLAPVLRGYRGKAPVNRNAVLDAIMALQTYVEARRPAEVEINPLICTQTRAVAADALIRTGGETR
ncbi:acetate--CoA ligase family protein [Pacificoceanicola onchidii]|uniref:acetate--CoA ligase family protein n=1 Tax=Pacificoceanicola onchidii TaxID=2562685 RepID=UPI0010A462CF|nr:acetate--CoA ligase family protein [Pacificoceanicola onchidii]